MDALSADANGTEVPGADASRIGTIVHLMICKAWGKVAQAEMGVGAFQSSRDKLGAVP